MRTLKKTGWRRLTLKDVTCGNAFGPRFSSDHYSQSGNIGTIRTTDLNEEGHINYSTIPFANLPEDILRSHFLNDGDLLITRSGTCGIPCIFESQSKPIVAGAFLIRFQLTGDVVPKFIHSLLNSEPLQRQIESMSSGGVQKNLTGTNLLKLKFDLPPLPEQQKIAAILSTWDRAIELTEKLIAAKQKRKQALMQQLLTGKVRFKGSEAKWTERRLCTLATFVNGRAFKPDEWKESGVPIIRIQNLNGSPDFNYFQGVYDERHRVFSGDLLFSWSGSRGTSFGPCFWHGPEGVLNQHIFRVLPHDGVQQRFLGHALEFVTVMIERKAHGSAGLVHVTKKELERYTVKVPPLHVQEDVAEILDNAESEVSILGSV